MYTSLIQIKKENKRYTNQEANKICQTWCKVLIEIPQKKSGNVERQFQKLEEQEIQKDKY